MNVESRSAEGGKCDERMDIPMPNSLKERLAALAVIGNYPSASVYVREVLARHVYGELALLGDRMGRPVAGVDGRNAG